MTAYLDPMEVEGAQFISCTEMRTGLSVSRGRKVITIMLNVGPIGMMQGFSVDGARAFAASLTRIADRLEQEAAQQAASHIDKARKA